MKNKILGRIQELREEQATGRKTLAELESRTAAVKSQMLRISGAIKVLEELLDDDDSNSDVEVVGSLSAAT